MTVSNVQHDQRILRILDDGKLLRREIVHHLERLEEDDKWEGSHQIANLYFAMDKVDEVIGALEIELSPEASAEYESAKA